jgi:hypothetical protein
MEHPARDSLWRPGPVFALACGAVLFAVGFALSAQPQQASAGGLLPTVTLPGVTTVTLPTPTVSTGTTTPVTTTPVTVTSPAPGAQSTVTTTRTSTPAGASRSAAQVSGAKRLPSGAISIPISSVRAPARLRLVVKFVPNARTASVSAQVVDSRGYLVRGARVSMLSAPARLLVGAKPKLSAVDGQVVFLVQPRKTAHLGSTVALTIRAVDPSAPALANASGRLRLTIRARS